MLGCCTRSQFHGFVCVTFKFSIMSDDVWKYERERVCVCVIGCKDYNSNPNQSQFQS